MTRPRISVIIPALRVSSSLRQLTVDLGKADIFEILIISPGSPLPMTGPKLRAISARTGRGPQIQAGLDAARGDIIWILHSDSHIPPGAVNALRAINKEPSVSLGCFPLGFDKTGFWLSLFAAMSRFDSPFSTFGDQGYFFNRRLLGDLPDLNRYPLMEDVVIRRALLGHGRVKKSVLTITTSARRFDRYGPLLTQLKNAATLISFWLGTSPEKLYQDYYGLPHPAKPSLLKESPALPAAAKPMS